MSVSTLFLALASIVGAMVTYSLQRSLDRRHAVLAERRKLYEECAAAFAGFMYRQVNINSEHHRNRRDSINQLGQRVCVLAPVSVRAAFKKISNHFSEKEKGADEDGNIRDFFDENAGVLVDELLAEMRKDALPRDLWGS